ncbi:hypothetical protein AAFF_G00400500 [Aldrovandia affinis]|uniref:Uncharacterized protein n=1 Tax=Aldrovandia affinis TaxID=143900 RepID=A0AAD7SER7_9TELE|nr:hypothetical protein AAFF_G00400500 [Aldrovandia affinis]
MDTVREHESNDMSTDSDVMTEEDIQWNAHFCKTPDRKHVNKLLDYSEDSFSKEFSNQLHVQPDWEEAVHGWSRCAPMVCLFQLQKKCKKAKTGDNGYHCLLCIDVKLSQNAEPDQTAGSESSEANGSSAEEHEDKGFPFLTTYQRRPLSAISCASTGRDNLKDKEKVADAFQETSLSLAIINLVEQCPLDKGKESLENFIILPPVKGLRYPWSGLTRGSLASCSFSTADSLTAENGSYGTPATEEMCAEGEEATQHTPVVTKVSEDSFGNLISQYRPCQFSKKLLSAFSIGIPKRCITSCDESLPQCLVGGKVKSDGQLRLPTKINFGHRTKGTEPSLPALLGTRVPILSASHRMIYPPNV